MDSSEKIIIDRVANMSSREGIKYLLKEVEKSHTKGVELKRIVEMVKKEREVLLYELKKYQHVFNTYHQLQTRLIQLLNKNHELSQHKLFLFTNIKRLEKEMNASTGVPPEPLPDLPTQLIPLCLQKLDLSPIPLPPKPEKPILNGELEFLPDLPPINRFNLPQLPQRNGSPSKPNTLNQKLSPKNSRKHGLKPISFVYNSTIIDSNSIHAKNNHNIINNTCIHSNCMQSSLCKQLYPNEVKSSDESKQQLEPQVVKSTEEPKQLRSEAKLMTHLDTKRSQKRKYSNDNHNNELKISEQMDYELSEQNMKNSQIKPQKYDSQKKCIEKSSKMSDNSHIKRLRENINYHELIEEKLLQGFKDHCLAENTKERHTRLGNRKTIESGSNDLKERVSSVKEKRRKSDKSKHRRSGGKESVNNKEIRRRDKAKHKKHKSKSTKYLEDKHKSYDRHEFYQNDEKNPQMPAIDVIDESIDKTCDLIKDYNKTVNSLVRVKSVLAKVEHFATKERNDKKSEETIATENSHFEPKCEDKTQSESIDRLSVVMNKTEEKTTHSKTQINTCSNISAKRVVQKTLPKKHTKLTFKLKRNNTLNHSLSPNNDNTDSNNNTDIIQQKALLQRKLRDELLQKNTQKRLSANNS